MTGRKIGFLALVSLGADSIIGLGIYTLPGHLVQAAGPFAVFLFPICALMLTPIALNIAQMAKLTSRSGGSYTHTSMAFGKFLAFPLGWCNWLASTIGLGAFSGVLGSFVASITESKWFIYGPGVAFILVTTLINLSGIRPGARAMLGVTALKVLPLVCLAGAGLFLVDLPKLSLMEQAPLNLRWSDALIATLFICQGFEYIPVVAGEAQNATRWVPRAVLTALWLAALLYTVLMISLISSPVAGSANPLVIHAKNIFGPMGGSMMQAAACLSVLGLMAARALAVPHMLTPLAEDGFLPRIFAYRLPRTEAPIFAILASAVVALLFAFGADLGDFIHVSSLGISLQYFLTCLSLLVVTKREESKTIFLPVIGMSVSVVFLTQIRPVAWLMFLEVVGTGLLLVCLFKSIRYLLWPKHFRTTTDKIPAHDSVN